MTDTLADITVNITDKTPTKTPIKVCRSVVFSASGHRFALPLGAIARIVHRTLLQRDRNDLFYFENQPLDLIHLSQLLQDTRPKNTTAPSQVLQPTESQFFIIVQQGQQPLGLAADTPPVLLDLPLDAVHAVPQAYHQKLQGLASQMISLKNEAANEAADGVLDTVFLLNLHRVATLIQQPLAMPLA
jgi:hypothetical protein